MTRDALQPEDGGRGESKKFLPDMPESARKNCNEYARECPQRGNASFEFI